MVFLFDCNFQDNPDRSIFVRPAMHMTSIMLLLALLLQGCGHKGAMYLPQEPGTSPQANQTPSQSVQKK